MRCLVWACGLFLLAGSLRADGLPFTKDRRHLDTPVTVIRLTPAQRRDVERRRFLVLTEAQWKRLCRVKPGLPRQFEVFTARYDDCTCGLGNFAVWFRPGEVEIPHWYLVGQAEVEADESHDGPSKPSLNLVVDGEARVWLKGKHLDGARLEAWIAGRSAEEGLYLDTPPPLNPKLDARIKRLVARLKAFAERRGLSLGASGF